LANLAFTADLRRLYAIVLGVSTLFSLLTARLVVDVRHAPLRPWLILPTLGSCLLLLLAMAAACRWSLRSCHAWGAAPSAGRVKPALREIRRAPWILGTLFGIAWTVFRGGLFLWLDDLAGRPLRLNVMDLLDLSASFLGTVTVVPLLEWLLRPLALTLGDAGRREGIATEEGALPLGALLLVFTVAIVVAPALSIVRLALGGNLAPHALKFYLPALGSWILLSTFGLSRFVVSPLQDALTVAGTVTRADGTLGPERIVTGNTEEFALFGMAMNRMLDRLTLAQEELALRLAERERFSEEAKKALHTRDEFINIAAHELRTPLTVLALQLDSLSSSLSSTTQERARRQIRRLAALIDTLLDVSRIQLGKLELQPEQVNLNRFLQEQAIPQDGRPVSLELPPYGVEVRADSARLEQVLANLMSNARRYAPEGTSVVVKLWTEGQEACLDVEDQGPGIAEQERERVFERFYRAEGARRAQSGGLGLGLYICRSIVNAHGGRIWAGEAGCGGAAIHVRLPLSRATSGAESGG
jgi:signal transduction histidine kinase